ncbi:MAG: hypothetical protein QNK37_09000 [Acidobacteriota bacterium]|nr:hypothetical protein [Acidobacteriota bacterium]
MKKMSLTKLQIRSFTTSEERNTKAGWEFQVTNEQACATGPREICTGRTYCWSQCV